MCVRARVSLETKGAIATLVLVTIELEEDHRRQGNVENPLTVRVCIHERHHRNSKFVNNLFKK